MQRGTVLTGDTSKQVRDQKEFEATQVGCYKQKILCGRPLSYEPKIRRSLRRKAFFTLWHPKYRVFSLVKQMNIFLVNMKNQTMQVEH